MSGQGGDRVRWVALPPGGSRRAERPTRRRAYTGPPAYPATPRWGFPLVSWRWPLSLPTRTPKDPAERTSALTTVAVPLLWITAGTAGGAALAEAWRYVLLLRSRYGALSRTTLAISDALVITTGVLLVLLGVLAVVAVLRWVLRARDVAGAQAGTRAARPDWQVVVGVFAPLVNLAVPGSVLAELEHTALIPDGARRAGKRPAPSRLVRRWWLAWVVSMVLGTASWLWGLRDGVQAMADGVLLHLLSDLSIVVLAVLTVRVIDHLNELLLPVDAAELSREQVLAVRDAPAPARLPRPADAPR